MNTWNKYFFFHKIQIGYDYNYIFYGILHPRDETGDPEMYKHGIHFGHYYIFW
jgi:hypothetical protein